MITFDPFNYRCDSGACPGVKTDGDTVTITEDTTPGQQVVTTRAAWEAYLDGVREGVRMQERKRIANVFRKRGDWHRDRGHRQASYDCYTDADLIEAGDFE